MRVRELIIVFGLVLSLALFGVIALLDAVLDPTDNTDPQIVERDLSGEEAGVIHLVRALSSTDSEGVAHLHLDGYDINSTPSAQSSASAPFAHGASTLRKAERSTGSVCLLLSTALRLCCPVI